MWTLLSPTSNLWLPSVRFILFAIACIDVSYVSSSVLITASPNRELCTSLSAHVGLKCVHFLQGCYSCGISFWIRLSEATCVRCTQCFWQRKSPSVDLMNDLEEVVYQSATLNLCLLITYPLSVSMLAKFATCTIGGDWSGVLHVLL